MQSISKSLAFKPIDKPTYEVLTYRQTQSRNILISLTQTINILRIGTVIAWHVFGKSSCKMLYSFRLLEQKVPMNIGFFQTIGGN